MSQISKLISTVSRLSPLRIRVFYTCRLRYRYQYLNRIPARLRPQDTVGSLLHRVLCDFFSKVPVEERDGQRLIRMFEEDRKSTRLNSSHQIISYAVFCLKKKKNTSMNLSLQ